MLPQLSSFRFSCYTYDLKYSFGHLRSSHVILLVVSFKTVDARQKCRISGYPREGREFKTLTVTGPFLRSSMENGNVNNEKGG